MIFVLDFGRGSKKAVIKKITEGVKGGARENKAKTKSGGGESKNKKRLLTPSTIDSDSVKNP